MSNPLRNAIKGLERRGDPKSGTNEKFRQDATMVACAILRGFRYAFDIDRPIWEDDLTWDMPRGYGIRCVKYHGGSDFDELSFNEAGRQVFKFTYRPHGTCSPMNPGPEHNWMDLEFAERLASDVGTGLIGEMWGWMKRRRGEEDALKFMGEIPAVVNNPTRPNITGSISAV